MIKKSARKAKTSVAKDGPNPVDVYVGQRVRTRRTLMGLSQEKLGEAIGLTFQQVQKYERGTNRISASKLWKLSKILDVSVSYFFEDLGEGDAPLESSQPVPTSPDMVKRETLELVRAAARLSPATIESMLALARALGQPEPN